MKNKLKQLSAKQIAQLRIDILFAQADAVNKTNPALATEYIKTAQKVAMSARFPLPPKYKHRICKHCKTLLTPGHNNRVRIQQKREPHIVATCLNCGYNSRISLTKPAEKERAKIEQTHNISHETTR